jgi:hypothetical protein
MQRKMLIPIALIAALLVGIVAAYVYSEQLSATSTTTDPLTFSWYKDLSISYPGETVEVIFTIANGAPDVTYGLIITVTLHGTASASYAYDGTSGTLSYTGSNWDFNIAPGNGYLWLKVTADPAGAPGTIQVGITVERVAHF